MHLLQAGGEEGRGGEAEVEVEVGWGWGSQPVGAAATSAAQGGWSGTEGCALVCKFHSRLIFIAFRFIHGDCFTLTLQSRNRGSATFSPGPTLLRAWEEILTSSASETLEHIRVFLTPSEKNVLI